MMTAVYEFADVEMLVEKVYELCGNDDKIVRNVYLDHKIDDLVDAFDEVEAGGKDEAWFGAEATTKLGEALTAIVAELEEA